MITTETTRRKQKHSRIYTYLAGPEGAEDDRKHGGKKRVVLHGPVVDEDGSHVFAVYKNVRLQTVGKFHG